MAIDAAEVEASSPAGVHRVDRETPCAWIVPAVDCVLSAPSARFAPHVVRTGVGSRPIELVQWEPRRIGVCIVQHERPASGVLVRLRSAADGAVVAVDRDFAARWRSANHQQHASLFEARAAALRGPAARVPRPATDAAARPVLATQRLGADRSVCGRRVDDPRRRADPPGFRPSDGRAGFGATIRRRETSAAPAAEPLHGAGPPDRIEPSPHPRSTP